MDTTPTRYTGIVKLFFDENAGYGFIGREGESDIFFYWSELENPKITRHTLARGQKVSFEIAPSKVKPGQVNAINIHIEPTPPKI